MSTLTHCIKNGSIKFYSQGKKIDTSLDDFGKYNLDLIKHISTQYKEFLAVEGMDLELLLSNHQNLFEFTDFIVQLQFSNSGLKCHIDADIEKLGEHYSRPKKHELYSLKASENQDQEGVVKIEPDKKIADTASWALDLNGFEYAWNWALDFSIGGMVGYPGYEHPITEQDFENTIALHAQNFIIGKKEQLSRYKQWPAYKEDRKWRGVESVKEGMDSILDYFASS